MIYKNMSTVVEELTKQQEEYILGQLKELTERGIIVLEKGPQRIVEQYTKDDYKYVLSQEIRFVPKEKEYIEKLENENKELKELISEINEVNEKAARYDSLNR